MTVPYDNIARAFGELAQSNADLPAIIALEEVITYADLWLLVRRIAARMQGDGVGRGSLVAVNLQDMRLSLGVLLATALIGAGYVVAGPNLAKAQVLRPTHFYRAANMAGNPRVNFRVIDAAWLDLAKVDDTNVTATDPDAEWLYLHTSGTTGTPKYLGLSQRMVWDRSCAAAIDFPFRQTTFASFFPSTSRPFYARALAALFQACTIVEGIDFDRWHNTGVNFVCGSPNQVSEALGDRVLHPKMDRLEISGAPLSDAAASQYLRSFRNVRDVYGASETSKSFANDLTVGQDAEIIRTGVPCDSVVEIVDQNGNLCPIGEVGIVRVRNSYIARGYVSNAEATARAFAKGWFFPGDIARWGPRGALVILGRDDATLNIGGYKINATLLEMIAKTVPGVNDAVCFQNPIPATRHPVIAFLVFAPHIDRFAVTEQVMQQVAERLGHVFARKNLRAIDQIPLTADGQHDRKACQAMVLTQAKADGELT